MEVGGFGCLGIRPPYQNFVPRGDALVANDPVSMGKYEYGYERISSGLAPVVTPFHGLIPH